MRSFTAATLMCVPLLAAGCMGRVGYTATVSNEAYAPEMAYAAPGVQVIVDYDEPIFYADSFYWRFYGGGWYRSPHHNGGWVYATPPPAVRGIGRPQSYVHYRPEGWTGHHEHYQQQAVRGQPAPQVYQQQPRAPQQQWQQPQRAPQQQWQQPQRAPQQQWQQPQHAPQQQWQQPQHAPQQQWQQQPPGAARPEVKGRDHHDDQGRGEHHGDGDHHDHH